MKEYQEQNIDLEKHNLEEIEGLSQRGRTLSIVDLIKANTLSIDMATYSLYSIAHGASFLTAARPGNAGKTTLLACLLTLLPPGIKFITVSGPDVILEAHKIIGAENPQNFCFLPHELGHGRWYGYLWGKYVGKLMSLMKDGCRVASCIHADTLPELQDIMVSRELGVLEEDFNHIDLIMFMKLERLAHDYRRRVLSFYDRNSKGHDLIYSWDHSSDAFHENIPVVEYLSKKYNKPLPQINEDFNKCRLFFENLVKSDNTDFRWVRYEVFKFYSSNF